MQLGPSRIYAYTVLFIPISSRSSDVLTGVSYWFLFVVLQQATVSIALDAFVMSTLLLIVCCFIYVIGVTHLLVYFLCCLALPVCEHVCALCVVLCACVTPCECVSLCAYTHCAGPQGTTPRCWPLRLWRPAWLPHLQCHEAAWLQVADSSGQLPAAEPADAKR